MSKSKHPKQRSSIILPDEPFPLFQLERRKLKWASTPDRAITSLVWIFVPPVIALLMLWLVFIYRDHLIGKQWNLWYENYMWFIFVGTMTLLAGSLDFASMVITFGSIRNEHVLKRWDLLILAANKEQIIRSKHNFARLRIARFLVFNLSVRVSVLLMIGLLLLFYDYLFGYYNNPYGYWQELAWQIREYPLIYTTIGIMATLICGFYLLEPIWRVNAFTAIGVALSARIKHITLLAPVSFVIVILMWVLQGMIIWIYGFCTSWVSYRFSDWYWNWVYEKYPEYPRPNWVNDIQGIFYSGGLFITVLLFIFITNRCYRILKGVAYKSIYTKIP